jgi:hypothetical protein
MTTLNIQYVNEAKPDKKYGTIKTRDGESYALPAGMAGVFQPNTTVEVPTQDQKWGDKVVHVIMGRPANSNAAPAAAAPAPPIAPAASARMADPKDTLIFVTGVVGRAMGSGSFGVTDIDLLTKAALAAYRTNLG